MSFANLIKAVIVVSATVVSASIEADIQRRDYAVRDEQFEAVMARLIVLKELMRNDSGARFHIGSNVYRAQKYLDNYSIYHNSKDLENAMYSIRRAEESARFFCDVIL